MHTNIKSSILLIVLIILAQLPTIFFGSTARYDLGLIIERSTRIDFFVMYYTTSINFLILAYCLHYNVGISRSITRLVLILCLLDFIHLALFAKQGFGMAKVGIAMVLFFTYEGLKARKQND